MNIGFEVHLLCKDISRERRHLSDLIVSNPDCGAVRDQRNIISSLSNRITTLCGGRA
jgi:hypothetical protein